MPFTPKDTGLFLLASEADPERTKANKKPFGLGEARSFWAVAQSWKALRRGFKSASPAKRMFKHRVSEYLIVDCRLFLDSRVLVRHCRSVRYRARVCRDVRVVSGQKTAQTATTSRRVINVFLTPLLCSSLFNGSMTSAHALPLQ